MEHSSFGWISVQRRRSGCPGTQMAGFSGRFLCSVILAVILASLPGPVAADLLDDEPVIPGNLERPLNSVPYADAMLDCAERIYATFVVGCDLVPAELELRHSFWIWRSETGATISRTLDGDYRIRTRSCLGGFCSWLSCRVTKWPVLDCSDGDKRKAAVPDSSHFKLGGTEYVRVREMR